MFVMARGVSLVFVIGCYLKLIVKGNGGEDLTRMSSYKPSKMGGRCKGNLRVGVIREQLL